MNLNGTGLAVYYGTSMAGSPQIPDSEHSVNEWPDPQSSDSGATGGSTSADGWPTPAPVPDSETTGGNWPEPAPKSAETSGESGAWPTTPADGGQDDVEVSSTEAPGSELPDSESIRSERKDGVRRSSDPKMSKATWIAAAVIIVTLPIAVGVVAFIQTTSESENEAAVDVAALAAPSDADAGVSVAPDETPDPIWTRPTWADSVRDMVAFELPADADVRLANGRLRPTLGISCVEGQTNVHLLTGGAAPIDPVTSGHVVKLSFDGAPEAEQRWVASDDQRALLAPEPLDLALQIASSRRLGLGFTHYMTGSEVVEFDLRGADTIVASMAEPCGWSSD